MTASVARNYFKLLAYKDEYEVARLYTAAAFRKDLESQFEGNFRIKILLAPPFLSRRDRRTGEPRKIAFGPWVLHIMKLMAAARRLRGTRFDVFGYTAERKLERQLISDYEASVQRSLAELSMATHESAIARAEMPDAIRGFGHVKARSVDAVRKRGWDDGDRDPEPVSPGAEQEMPVVRMREG